MSAPALFTQTSRRPSASRADGPSGAERLIVGQVEADDGRATSERSNLALDFARALFVRSIRDRDVGPGASGGECDGPADAARGARHEHGAAGERRGDGVGRHKRVLYDPPCMVSNRMADNPGEVSTLRLTSLSHGGGCGCKLAPAVLEQIIAKAAGSAASIIPPQLLVGIETSDDAAVYQINETQAIVATTDFFMPIVDDPFDFGAIAATNAISDVYAMGGSPLFALALVAMPIDKVPLETIRRILQGGESVCQRAGIPVAGGHSVDSVEPIYGLVAIGLVDPRDVKRNADAKPGDKVILGKALGVGVYGAAAQEAADYRRAVSRDDRQHDTTQYAGPPPGSSSRCPCADRCHGFRTARSPARSVQRLPGPRHSALERCAVADVGAGPGRRRTCHRRLEPQLEKLWQPGRRGPAR